MKVLLVGDIIGGVGTFVRELVPQLAAREVEVHLALLGRDPPGVFSRLGARTCEVRDLRLEWMGDPWRDVAETSDWIAQLCALHGPDVVHMNTFTPVQCAEPPVLLTVHSCVLSWWRAVRGCEAPTSWDRYRRTARLALERASLVTVPTRAFLNELESVYGALPATRVIPNGRLVRRDPRPERERLVLSVGRIWDQAKNARLLARAADAIDARVALIGPGELGDGALGAVNVLGALDEAGVLEWLSRASVFAAPARYEPFGLAALEAALCGCPLVLGDIPSLREVWGAAARFISPDDHAALASEVSALLADRDARERAARDAHAVARGYSPVRMADTYLNGYIQAAGSAVVG